MKREKHKQRHIELHKAVNELFADFIGYNPCLDNYLDVTINQLMKWSHEQTQYPAKEAHKSHPLPPAEGAEAFLRSHKISGADFVYTTGFENMVELLREFATLHAQRIADKMVEERLRKELIAYDKLLYYKWIEGDVTTTEEHINEYLKSREK